MEREVLFEDGGEGIGGWGIGVLWVGWEGSWGVGELGEVKVVGEWGDERGEKGIEIVGMNDRSMRGRWSECYGYKRMWM